MAICDSVPIDGEEEGRVFAEVNVLHSEYEQGLGQLVLTVKPEWAGASVVVTAWIDVGFARVQSRPHVIGRLAGTARRVRG